MTEEKNDFKINQINPDEIGINHDDDNTLNKSENIEASSSSMRSSVKKGRYQQKSRYRLDFDQETLSMARLIAALYPAEETGTKEEEKMLFVVRMAIKSYFNGPFQNELKKLTDQE